MKRNSNSRILIIFVLLVIIGIADVTFNIGLGKNLRMALRPVGIVFSETGSGIYGFFNNFRNIGKLQQENRELTDKLNSATAEIATLREAQKENFSLKKDLGYKEQSDYDLVAANVISFDPANIRETITIGAGKSNGIKEGDVVISEGFLVGKIVNVGDFTSKIKLISDPTSSVAANISNSLVSGVLKGRIGNGLSLEQVPQSEKVTQDDTVVTSGLGGDFPKGIVIGKVEDIQKVSGSIFQTIAIRPMVDLNKLERVMVIKK